MILSDATLTRMIESKELVVEPLSAESIQPASIDCRLGDHFLIVESLNMNSLKLDQDIDYREVTTDRITIAPHSFLLATTQEFFELPDDLTAFVEGRSSIGRMGLFIQNAGWVDPGFKGKITLELYNANSLPIELVSGRRICQMVFARMNEAAKNPYRGKYQGQSLAVGSRISHDTEVC